VTVLAFDFRFVEVGFMPNQTEIGQPVVFKVSEGQQGNIGVPTFVFGVAVFAAGGIVQTAVQPQPRRPFLGNCDVASFAAFGRNALPGGVALAAFLLEFGMVIEAVQRFLARGSLGQRAWAKWAAALKDEDGRQANDQYYCRAAAKGRV
jgi:hypothetical protein